MTLEEFFTLWIDTYVKPKRADSTWKGYQYAFAHVPPQLRRTGLDALDPLSIQRMINETAAETPRQAQILTVALRASLTRAKRLGMIDRNPMELVGKPNHRKRDICYFSAEEAAAYVRALEGRGGQRALLLMLCLGLRRNEARAIRAGDLMEDGTIRIRYQRRGEKLLPLKTESSVRILPVPEGLRWIFNGPAGEYLCPGSESWLRRQHIAAMKAAGIDRPVTLHGLRHTAATLAIKEGVPLTTVQRLLGHRHYNLTADIYIHSDLDALRRCTFGITNVFQLPA